MEQQNNEYMNLVLKEMTEDISEVEQKLLSDWIEESDDNKILYAEYKKLWSVSKYMEPPEAVNVEEQWNIFEEKIRPDIETAKELKLPDKKPKGLFNGKVSYFAAAAAVLIIALSVRLYIISDPDYGFVTVSTENAETKDIVLDDGTQLKINAGSYIKYKEFSKNENAREVFVSGEVLFDVAKGRKSFIVETENSKIKVFGTKFNVWTRNNKTKVTVESGSIGFLPKYMPASQGQIILAGQKVEYENDKDFLPAVTADLEKELDWIQGNIIFDSTPLIEVAAELERSFGIKINVVGSMITDKKISGAYHTQPIEDIVESICLTLGLNYKFENNIYTISH